MKYITEIKLQLSNAYCQEHVQTSFLDYVI